MMAHPPHNHQNNIKAQTTTGGRGIYISVDIGETTSCTPSIWKRDRSQEELVDQPQLTLNTTRTKQQRLYFLSYGTASAVKHLGVG